jgi:TonB family protein
VLISIVGHLALISVSGMIDLRDNVKAAEIITVDLKETEPTIEPTKKEEEQEKKEVKKPKDTKEAKDAQAIGSGWREDTIDLNSTNPKYYKFLLDMKRQLNGMWTKLDYMKKLAPGTGVVTLVVSVNEDGSIYNIDITASSGPKILEQNAKLIVSSVAKFNQLTDGLSRLHVAVRIPFTE